MKVPDKIYVGLTNSEFGGVVYDTVSATFPNAKEYIRKDALLEWLNRMLEISSQSFEFQRNYAYGKVIDKLNEM